MRGRGIQRSATPAEIPAAAVADGAVVFCNGEEIGMILSLGSL
jgi:hypothetical protein